MTNDEKLTMLKCMVDETDEDVLSTYLTMAAYEIISRAFPFGDGTDSVPAKYESNQVEIAAYLVNKRGAEGESSHNENGVSIQYEDGHIPPSLFRNIVPVASVL